MKNMSAVAVAALALLAVPLEAGVTGKTSKRSPQGVPVVDITFEPISAAHPTCPPFGPCPPGSQVTTEYTPFGVDFTTFGSHPPVGVFSDPPEKFGGVNAGGDLDLLTASCGRIVLVGTTTQGLTDFIASASGGVDGPGSILLEAFDANGTLINSSIADDGADADGDLIAEVADPNGAIASFCISTPNADLYGMHFVYLNTPVIVPVELQSFEIQ